MVDNLDSFTVPLHSSNNRHLPASHVNHKYSVKNEDNFQCPRQVFKFCALLSGLVSFECLKGNI